MKCNFYIGQKVVCVNNKGNFSNLKKKMYPDSQQVHDKLIVGNIYTIRDIFYDHNCTDDGIVVLLKEIERVKYSSGRESGFHHSRFRPLEKKSTDVGFNVLMNICKNANVKEEA